MLKIALIGAGSVVFTKTLVGDILSYPELSHATISLMDIDEERLQVAENLTRKIIQSLQVPAKVESSLHLSEALKDADYVISMIQVGGFDATLIDFNIPEKYGVKQTIADTLGIGGIFRSLRTIPELLKIVRTMEQVCPNAYFLNYTNPMAMNIWALYESSNINMVGLCHSVQGTSEGLAKKIQVPYEEITYKVAGINHMAWFMEFKHKGKDAYPLLRNAMEDPEIYKTDKVRFELMRHFGYFVTESSEHLSEYTPYFIQHEPLIDELSIPIREYVRRCENILDEFEQNKKLGLSDEKLQVKRSREYGSWIIHGIESGTRHCIHGNVKNTGLITNLPYGACVEVPCMVDQTGIHPCYVGDLPPQLAALNRSNIHVQELVVKAALEKNRDHVYHAAYLDPHTQSILPLAKIREMVDEMFEAHGDAIFPKAFTNED